MNLSPEYQTHTQFQDVKNDIVTGTLPPLLLAAKAGHYDVIRILRQHRDRNESDPTVATTKFTILVRYNL